MKKVDKIGKMKGVRAVAKKAEQVVFHLADNPKMNSKEKRYFEGTLNALNWVMCPHCPDPFKLQSGESEKR